MTQLYLTMPQPGETITEGMIVSWVANIGDVLKEGDPVAELETEKAVFEYESPFEGKIVKILHPAETRVEVSKPIAIMDVADDKAANYMMLGIAEAVEGDVAASVESTSVNKEKSKEEKKTAPVSIQNYKDLDAIKLSPYVRRVAFEKGLGQEELLELANQNEDGRVTKQALLNYLEGGKRSRSPMKSVKETSGNLTYETMPFSPIRMRIAENMNLSKQNIPHAHTGLSIDVTNMVKFREENKKKYKEKYGTNLNFLTLMQKALVQAIKKFPSVNASFIKQNEKKSEIRLFNQINLGVAVGSEHGLVIPVVHNSDQLNSQDFNNILNDKIKRAGEKKLMPDDYQNATIIFNNFGYFGITHGVQIIQYPLSCTLGMGVMEDRVVPFGEGIAVRKMADLFIAFDHRILDGREAGLFLSMIKKSIESESFTDIL